MKPQPDDEDWLRRIGVVTAHTQTAGPAAPTSQPAAQDLDVDDPPTEPMPVADVTGPDVVGLDPPTDTARRFTPWVAAVFTAVAVVATATTAGAAALTSKDPAPPPPNHPSLTARPAAPLPPPTPQNADAPIPFTATADCPPGSTAAQSLADPQAKTPWICARTVDGQVLHIDLGRAYVITAITIVPGAITGGDDQADPWLQHRVVTRIQWQFNDTDKTVRNQNTGDVRGEAVLPVPDVLASAITAIIQQTSRPPATAPTTTPPPGDSLLAPILGPPPATGQPSAQLPDDTPLPDPSDGTFAVTAVKVIGHKTI